MGGGLYAKVLDCGLARALKGGAAGGGGKSITGGVVGTLGYMAPELLAGAPASRASDAYALGVLLFEMLTGVEVRDAVADHPVVRRRETVERAAEHG